MSTRLGLKPADPSYQGPTLYISTEVNGKVRVKLDAITYWVCTSDLVEYLNHLFPVKEEEPVKKIDHMKLKKNKRKFR